MSLRGWKLALPWLLLLLAGLGTAWLRYGLIESSAIGQQCSGMAAPWWCEGRHWLVLGFLRNIYGIAALVLATLALLVRRPWLAFIAAAAGLFALELYCFQAGALALLIGCLRLLRLQSPMYAAPVDQHRQRQREIQAEP